MADVFEPESRRISDPRRARVIADDDGGGPAYISGADVWTPFQAFKIADGEPVTVLNAARGDTAYLYGTAARPVGIDQRLVDAVAQGSIELKYRLAVSAQEGMVGRVILHLDTFSDAAGTTRVQRHVLNYQSNTGIISGEGSSRLVFDSNVVSFRISADLSNVAAQANGTITLQITDVLFIASPEGLPAPRYLAADADLNSITERGIYARLSSTWTGQNNPFGTGSFLLYVNSLEGIGGRNNGHVQQLIYSFKQNQYYFVRETPAGDGSVPGIPETITADWQDRNNVAALAEADTRENISIIGQEQRAASVTPESHRITFSTEGFGPNQFFQLDYARLPIIQMRWRPDDYGINNERSQLQTFLRTSQLGGRTPEAVHVGAYNAEVRHAVTVTANADTDTTEIVATIPALLTLSETLLYFNLEFTDGTFLYHRTQTGETAPVRLEKAHAQTWLDVPEEATPQEVEGQTVTGKYISPGNLLTITPETSPRTVAHFSTSRELDLPADGETIQFSRSADGRTLTHTRRISRSEIGDIPNIMGIADNGGSYLVEYNNTDFIIRQPNYLSLNGTAIQSTNITLKVEIWAGTAEAPEALERLDILTHEQQIIEHHSIEELIHTSLDFAEFEQSREGSDTIPQTTEPRIDRAHEIRLVIEIEARGRTQFGTQAFNLAHTWIAAGDNEPYLFEHQLKHSLALADTVGPQGPQGQDGPQGPRGAQGPAGPAGADGRDGADGAAGQDGADGLRGPPGADGQQGDPGQRGPAGADGAEGPRGPEGPQGERGERGLQGIQGIQGPQGPAGGGGDGGGGTQGPAGPQGEQGPQGEPGERGPQGLRGPQGDPGARGPAGADGADGPRGPAGAAGADGGTGPRGPAGAQGIQGDTGPRGPAGNPGADGSDGARGPAGAQGAQGPRGDPGVDGARGAQGVAGAAGPKGDDGDRGPVGEQGERGPQGVAGAAGPKGDKGDKGDDGDTGPAGPAGAATIDLRKGGFTFGAKSINDRRGAGSTVPRTSGALTLLDISEDAGAGGAAFANVENYTRTDPTNRTTRSGQRITFTTAGILSASGSVRIVRQDNSLEQVQSGVKLFAAIRSGSTAVLKVIQNQYMNAAPTSTSESAGARNTGLFEFIAPITLAAEDIAVGDKLEIWTECLSENAAQTSFSVVNTTAALRGGATNDLELRLLVASATSGGGTTDITGKADTDLGNVDADLTAEEKTALLAKIGAQAAGAVTDITGKADTDLGNVDADLTDTEKTALLAKIGAPGTDLATVDSDLTDAEKLALRTKIGAAAPGEAGSGGGGAAADVTTVDMNFTRATFNDAAFMYGPWTPLAPAQTGLVGPYLIALTSAMLAQEASGTTISGTGFNRVWIQFRLRKTSGATVTTEGYADEYYRIQAAGRENFWPDLSFVIDDLEATDSLVVEARAASSLALNNGRATGAGVARNTDATEGNLSQISFVPQRAGGAAPAEPAANADNPVIPKPPSDGTDYFLGEGSPPATEEVPNPAHIPAWRNFDDLLSQLAVRTLPDPNTLNRGDIRYLTGSGATEETGPGIHRVIANPVTPLNSITITVGTDSENANEHGASIDAAVGGEYGEFTRNPNNALASVTWFSPTAPAFDIDIRDDLVRGPPSPPTVQRNTLTIGTDRANTPSYGFTSPDTGYGQLSPRTVATRNILELTASEKYGGLTLQLILAGAVPASAITSLEIAGTVYLFSQATRIVRGSNTIFRWPGGSEIPLRPTAVLSVVFRIPATQGALPAEVNIQAVSGADFRYALRRDAPGDAMVGGVQYRHYDLKSTAEGGPGVPAADLTGLADGTEIGFRLWRDNTINNPLNVAPRNLWVWDDRPDFTGGFLDVPQFPDLPAVGDHRPGSLIYSDDNVYISRPAAPSTYATPNRVIINMAGHSYGIPGSQYRQNHNFNTNAVDDPTSFIGQMTWDAAPSGNGGDLSVYLRDDDAATPLPNVIIMRGQLFGTGPGGQNRLLRTETTQSIQVDGAAVTYRLYHAATTTWADDHFFNGLAQRTLTFYTAYISETSNTPLMAHPTTIILPSAWDRVSGDRIGPNVLAAVLDFGDNSTTAVNYATGMSIMGAHSVLMKFSMPGNAQLVQLTARAWREVRETYVANRAYAGYLGSAFRQDYLVTIADTSIIPLRIGRGSGPQLEELRGIF